MTEYIIVEGLHGKDRPRFNKVTGAIYTAKETRLYEQLIALRYKQQGGRDFRDQPVSVKIVACYKIAPSVYKARRERMLLGLERPAVKPDIDNVVKIVLDGLNHVAYNDDKQVICVQATKQYGERECVMISVERMKTQV